MNILNVSTIWKLACFLFIIQGNGLSAQTHHLGEITVQPPQGGVTLFRSGKDIQVYQSSSFQDYSSLGQFLQHHLGYQFTSSGPGRSQSTLRFNGSRPNQVQILLDGIPLSDPLHPDGSFNFSSLSLSGIDQIEVISSGSLHHSASATHIISLKSQTSKKNISLSLGNTEFLEGSFNYGVKGFFIGAGTQSRRNRSLSTSGPEKDRESFRALQLGYTQKSDVNFFTKLRFTQTNLELDQYQIDDPDYDSKREDFQAQLSLSKGFFGVKTSFHRIKRVNDNGPRPNNTPQSFDYDASRLFAELWFQKKWKGTLIKLQAPIERLGGSSQSDLLKRYENRKSLNLSAFLETPLRPFNLLASLRFDDYEENDNLNYEFSPGYVNEKLGLRIGSSFITTSFGPTLYQRFSFFGKEDLKTEENQSFEVFVEKFFSFGELKISALRQKSKELITYNFATSAFDNIEKYENDIFRFNARFDLSQNLKLRLGYHYTEQKDHNSGFETLHPKHQVHGDLTYFLGKLRLSAQANFRSALYFPTKKLPKLTLLNLHSHYPLSKKLSWSVSLQNLLDEEYESSPEYSGESFSASTKMTYSF